MFKSWKTNVITFVQMEKLRLRRKFCYLYNIPVASRQAFSSCKVELFFILFFASHIYWISFLLQQGPNLKSVFKDSLYYSRLGLLQLAFQCSKKCFPALQLKSLSSQWRIKWDPKIKAGNISPSLYQCDSLVAQMAKNLPAMWETWVRSLGWENPLEEGMATHFNILAWRIPMDRGVWWTIVHGVTESDTTEWLNTVPINGLHIRR